MERAERQEAKVVKRKSAARGKREKDDAMNSADDREDVVVLKRRIFRLEAENKQLRKQIAALSDTTSRSSQPRSDSVREQQHNFFKYGNVRRY
jgi:endo-beta-N-acetylglucosaminidase D